MKDARKILYHRLIWVLILTFFAFGAVIFKMTKVMFFERNYWNEVSATFLKDSIIVEPRRGDILSDQDLLMASSSPQYAIYIDFGSGRKDSTGKYIPDIKDQNKKDALFYDYLDEVCVGLADIIPGTSAEYWKNYLKKGHDKLYRHYALTKVSAPLSYNQYIELKKLKWFMPMNRSWFYSVESNTARTYPYGTLAGRVVGKIHIADDNKPRFGLELSFDSILRGTKGLAHQVQLQNRTREEIDVPAIDGSNVHTTLNVEMQDIAEQALKTQMEKVKEAVWGTAVVMEVATGDIKAMASLDVVNKETHALAEIRNNAVVGKYEPGSTFKTASILVGMEHGNIKMTDQVNTGKGINHFYHNDLKDHNYKGLNNPKSGYGVIDVPHILMYSSNIGVACLIDEHYHNNPEKYVQAICDLGYDHHWDMQLLGVDKPRIDKPGDEGVYWYEDYLAWMSIGYNVSFPIINTLVFYNSIANNGKLVAPRLVKYVTDNDGAVTETYPVQVVKEQICSRQTLVQVQEMLERVVSEGLAKAAGSPYFKVAGKTGTAQHSKGKAGYKDGGVEYLLSFCGYFPADDPKYSCVVAIYSDGGVASGGGICGPVFHEISEKIMAMIRTSDISQGVDTEHPFAPVVTKGSIDKAQIVLKSLGMDYRDDIELVPAPQTEMGVVPDVVGMGASDAVYLLESIGLKAVIKGVGNVIRQTPEPGTAAKNGDIVKLDLDIIH